MSIVFRPNCAKALQAQMQERILIIDGAMGTMLQRYGFGEEDFRGERFAQWPCDLKGNNDLLSLTQPQAIRAVHDAYLGAGADIIETNSFSSTSIAMADYGMEGLVQALNLASARIAREAADHHSTPEKPRYVAGAIGPTNRTASISPDVNHPGFRNVDFDQLSASYREQALGLIEGGVDMLLIETVFDTLNAKAAIHALLGVFDEMGGELPILITGTITDRSGRNLSGQTMEAFYYSIRHARPLAVGLNCAFGADLMRPYVADLARIADCAIIAYPNAGLPNAFGQYDEPPEVTSGLLREWAESGLINIVGGCCGTTPDHIKAIAGAVNGVPPRRPQPPPPAMRLAGLEAAVIPA